MVLIEHLAVEILPIAVLDPSTAALMKAYICNGETDKAAAFLDGLLAKIAEYLQALGLRGNLYLVSGGSDAALAAYQRTLTTDPGSAGARSALARLYQMTGKIAEAEVELLLGLEANPVNLSLKTILAQFREIQGKFASAIDLISEVQEQAPNSPIITNMLGSLLADHRSGGS